MDLVLFHLRTVGGSNIFRYILYCSLLYCFMTFKDSCYKPALIWPLNILHSEISTANFIQFWILVLQTIIVHHFFSTFLCVPLGHLLFRTSQKFSLLLSLTFKSCNVVIQFFMLFICLIIFISFTTASSSAFALLPLLICH